MTTASQPDPDCRNETGGFIRNLCHFLLPNSVRMLVYRWRHADFRLAEKLSEISRDGIETFLDSLAQQQLVTGNVLEVGAGGRRQNWLRFSPLAKSYWRSDVRIWPGGELELICDCTICPFPDHSLDVVVCSEVLEHVVDSQSALSEFGRMLRPNGWLVLTVPFFYPLHGVDDADRGDYWRFSPGNLKLLLQDKFDLVAEHRTSLFRENDSFIVNIQMLWRRRTA
jgi:SAM-dependent methyltransferase